jgi:hypothetical protein
MKRPRASGLLQLRNKRRRCRVGQLISIPRTLLASIFLCMKPSEVSRIACVSRSFQKESGASQLWNGMLKWPLAWLTWPRTDLFQSYMTLVLRQDPVSVAQFIKKFFPHHLLNELRSPNNLALDSFFAGLLSLFDLEELFRLRAQLFHHLFSQATPATVASIGFSTGQVSLEQLKRDWDRAQPPNCWRFHRRYPRTRFPL